MILKYKNVNMVIFKNVNKNVISVWFRAIIAKKEMQHFKMNLTLLLLLLTVETLKKHFIDLFYEWHSDLCCLL